MSPWKTAILAVLVGASLARPEDLATGKFLVASRDLGDPNFAETVVLLLRYDDEQGAMGLIVNRRSDVPLSQVFETLKSAKARTDQAYLGGPVELNAILALVKAPRKPDQAEHVFGDVYLIAARTPLEKALHDNIPPHSFHVFVGYAGWGPGQLEHEIELGAWHIMSADAASVFHADPDSVWKNLIRRTDFQIARLALR